MASSFCWSCLSKLRPAPKTFLPATAIPRAAAPFHSTASVFALPPKKSRSQDSGPSFREARSAAVRKKKANTKPHRETPTERKARAQQLVLSNANALEVPGLQDLSSQNMTDESLRGKVLGIPLDLLDNLRASGAFKTSQGWSLFRRPGTVVREDSLRVARLMNEIKLNGGTKSEMVIGDRFAGKSVILLQAMTMGLLNQWVVISVPNAYELVNGTTAYAPAPGSESGQIKYTQKNAYAQLLKRIADANAALLAKLHVSRSHPGLASSFTPAMTLRDLAMAGVSQPEIAASAFQALWSELMATEPPKTTDGFKPFQPRPPTLISIDGISHWMQNTKYSNAEFEPIHAHDFTFIDHFLTLPTKPMPNGGLVLYAKSSSNNPAVRTLDVNCEMLAARQTGMDPDSPEFPHFQPYEKLDARVNSFFTRSKDLAVMQLGGLTLNETKGLLEYYALSGIMRERITESLVNEKWTLSGGMVGELERIGRRVRILPAPA